MDASILQLFAADEILHQLTRKKLTGCFKVFNAQESASVFFKKGMIVAAVEGTHDGEAALREIIGWKDSQYVWEPDLAAPIPPLRPVLINFEAFLAKQNKLATKTTANGILTPNGAKTDGANSRTATKSITATAETRLSNDEDLLRKHRLVLVSALNPKHKFKLARVTNLIGRNPGCEITIPDPSISRQHCLLQITDRGLHAKDLNTVNGTKINGIPLKEGYINVGDKLTVGHLSFTVEGEQD
jgi:hypothetical protein